MNQADRNEMIAKLHDAIDTVDALNLGDDPKYREGHADGVQEVRDYMIQQVGYCHFGE